jgi:hypothetical protein
MTRKEIEGRLKTMNLTGRVWGRSGPDALDEISRLLNGELASDFSAFVEDVGNATIGGFNVVVAGSEDASFSAFTETEKLPSGIKGSIVVMEHAGEVYLYFPSDGVVRTFEAVPLNPVNETRRFSSFTEFLDWVFKESHASASDPRFR